MREILFRGKRLDNGEWIEGDLRQYPSGAAAIRSDKIGNTIKVDPATVGQYTDLKDIKGCKIFEGDVIRYQWAQETAGVIRFGAYESQTSNQRPVGFYVEWNEGWKDLRDDLYFWTKEREIEVIGNIHDNPDLIERSERDGHQTD